MQVKTILLFVVLGIATEWWGVIYKCVKKQKTSLDAWKWDKSQMKECKNVKES